jgi:hypothetical protein
VLTCGWRSCRAFLAEDPVPVSPWRSMHFRLPTGTGDASMAQGSRVSGKAESLRLFYRMFCSPEGEGSDTRRLSAYPPGWLFGRLCPADGRLVPPLFSFCRPATAEGRAPRSVPGHVGASHAMPAPLPRSLTSPLFPAAADRHRALALPCLALGYTRLLRNAPRWEGGSASRGSWQCRLARRRKWQEHGVVIHQHQLRATKSYTSIWPGVPGSYATSCLPAPA